jgi:hypothetical protein
LAKEKDKGVSNKRGSVKRNSTVKGNEGTGGLGN